MIHFLKKLQQRWLHFLHNEDLKQKVYTIVFESDTRKGRLFDLALMGCILLSVTLVMLESMHLLPPEADTALRVTEYVLTLFFTLEYLARIYCLKQPKSYVFSFFGIVDLLATLPVYLGFIFQGAHYLLVIRAFRLIRVFRIFKLFLFIREGNLLLRSLWISAPKISIFFFFVLILVTSMGTVMYMIEGVEPGSQQHPQQYLLGHRYHDHRGLRRHYSRNPRGTIPLSRHHANWIHHHCRTYGYRVGHHGGTIPQS